MATVRSLPIEEDDMLQTQAAISNSSAAEERRPLSPILVLMLAALAIYPFIVGFLPEPVRQYLGSLFR